VDLVLLVILDMVMLAEWVSNRLRQRVIKYQFKAQKRAKEFPFIPRVWAA